MNERLRVGRRGVYGLRGGDARRVTWVGLQSALPPSLSTPYPRRRPADSTLELQVSNMLLVDQLQ